MSIYVLLVLCWTSQPAATFACGIILDLGFEWDFCVLKLDAEQWWKVGLLPFAPSKVYPSASHSSAIISSAVGRHQSLLPNTVPTRCWQQLLMNGGVAREVHSNRCLFSFFLSYEQKPDSFWKVCWIFIDWGIKKWNGFFTSLHCSASHVAQPTSLKC